MAAIPAPESPRRRAQIVRDQSDVQIASSTVTSTMEDESGFNTSNTSNYPTADTRHRTTITSLPNELLVHIFSHIDPVRPSLALLRDEPMFDLTQSKITHLKSISRVSKRWRQAIIPNLFIHAQFTVRNTNPEGETVYHQLQPFFDFVSQHNLRKSISSFVLIVHDKKIADGPSQPGHTFSLSIFWKRLFGVIDPLDLLIVAPAEALGALTSCHIMAEDVWCFDCPCQYLRLQRPETGSPSTEPNKPLKEIVSGVAANAVAETTSRSLTPLPRSSTPKTSPKSSEVFRTIGSSLFDYHAWTKLLLNEGSFVRAYATYEFWLRVPPSILPDLVGHDTPPQKALITPTIRDMEYIGVFPMASHFSSLTKHCPRLDRLYIQLVSRNEILQNSSKMAQVESEDLWMERNSCYALLMRELFNSPPLGNYRHLKIFESGDAADKDAWNMAVEFVRRTSGHTWKVVGDGVFARDPIALATETEGGDDENPTSFEGELVRWAWNGTAILPVSASPLYNGQLNWQWH